MIQLTDKQQRVLGRFEALGCIVQRDDVSLLHDNVERFDIYHPGLKVGCTIGVSGDASAFREQFDLDFDASNRKFLRNIERAILYDHIEVDTLTEIEEVVA